MKAPKDWPPPSLKERVEVQYRERDANGVCVGIKSRIHPGSTWETENGTLNVYGISKSRPAASYPQGEWVHVEDLDSEHNPQP